MGEHVGFTACWAGPGRAMRLVDAATPDAIVLTGSGQRNWGKSWEEDEYDMWVPLSVRVVCNPGLGCFSWVRQTGQGFNLDLDCIIQDTNDRDLKFRVYFGEPLLIQGSK